MVIQEPNGFGVIMPLNSMHPNLQSFLHESGSHLFKLDCPKGGKQIKIMF